MLNCIKLTLFSSTHTIWGFLEAPVSSFEASVFPGKSWAGRNGVRKHRCQGAAWLGEWSSLRCCNKKQKEARKKKFPPKAPTPKCRPQRINNKDSDRCLYISVHSSGIPSHQNVETTHMAINWWMDKQKVTHPCNRILLNHKQEWSTNTATR